MLLGFKRRFAPFVEEGSKTHTIRAIGLRRRFRPGDICDCYVDSRQKTMRLLGRFRCTRVEDICIATGPSPSRPLAVWVGDQLLTDEEANGLFYRDGFRGELLYRKTAMQQAAEFWAGRKFPFRGHLIHWEFKPGTAIDKPKARKRRAGGKA